MINNVERFSAKPISASANISATQSGVLGGLFCSSASAATVKIYDGTDNTGAVIINTFTPVAGVNYAFPAIYTKGIYVEVTGTFTGTVFYI